MSVEFNRRTLAQQQATAERYHENLNVEACTYLENRGITQSVAIQFLLGVCDDIHPGWLSIPYLRPNGTVWFNYRRFDNGKPKYMASGARHLYNTVDLDTADKSGEIAIAEGELDTIVASALFGVPCVGIPGATQWSGNPSWHELFRGYEKVWVLADPDEAGEALAMAILDVLPNARIIRLPADVNDTYLAGHDIKEFMK